jgi:hypothetical protein
MKPVPTTAAPISVMDREPGPGNCIYAFPLATTACGQALTFAKPGLFQGILVGKNRGTLLTIMVLTQTLCLPSPPYRLRETTAGSVSRRLLGARFSAVETTSGTDVLLDARPRNR